MSLLVKQVFAQSTPSFPYEGPFKVIEPGPEQTVETAKIKLSTPASDLKVDQSFEVSVKVDSASTDISEYHVYISFDPANLEVVDQNQAEQDIQISVLDQVSTSAIYEVDNIYGRVEIVGTADQPASIDQAIATILFKTKQVGESSIRVEEEQSSITSDSENILETVNTLNLTITGSTSTTTIPSTGIFDTPQMTYSIFASLLLIFLAARIFRNYQKEVK